MTLAQWRSSGRFLLYVLLFSPLVVLPQFFVFPYVVPKVVAMRSLIVLMVAIAAVVGVRSGQWKQWKSWMTPLSAAIICFLAAQVLSMVFGYDWYRSMFETHERMLGVFTLIHFVLLYAAARTLVTSRAAWRRLWQWWLGASLLVIGIGIIQKFAPNFLFNRGNDRVLSTLGNPIYLAAYGLFTFFVSLRYACEERGWWQRAWIGGMVLGVTAIVIGGGRGTMVGLATGLSVMIALMSRLLSAPVSRRRAAAAGLAGIAVFGLFVAFRHVPAVQSLPIIGRLTSISADDYTGKTRLLAWGVALESWKDHPLLGWGPSNFYYAFSAHYNPAFLQFGFQETWFDNAHNVVVDSLASGGILGVLTYLAVFLAAGYTLVKGFKQKKVGTTTLIAGIGFLVAHFTHNLFVFENPTSYLALFLWFAWIDSETHHDDTVEETSTHIPWAMCIVALGVAVVILVFSELNVAVVAHNDFAMRSSLSQGHVTEALAIEEASRRWHSPYIYDLEWDLATDSIDPLPRVYSGDKAIARRLYDTAVSNMESVIARYPNDVRARLAYMDILRSGGMVLFELPVEKTVEENLKIAETLSPARQQVVYSKITFLAGTGHMDEALALTRTQIDRDPSIADGYYTLARLYAIQKNYYKIVDVLDRAMLAGVRFTDPVEQGFAAEGYEREGRFRDALYWYDQMYKSTGNDRVAYKRDELARQTQLAVPQHIEDFFPFSQYVSSTPSL